MEKMVDKSIFDGRETKIFFLMLKKQEKKIDGNKNKKVLIVKKTKNNYNNNTSIICNQNLFGMKGISKKTNDDIKKGLVCVFSSN